MERGDIVRVLPDLYAAGLHAGSFVVRSLAAAEWSGGTLTGSTALRLHGLDFTRDQRIHVVSPRPLHRASPAWLAIRRSDLAVPIALIASPRAPGQLSVHAPAFALAIGYGAVPVSERADLVFGAFRMGLVTKESLADALESLPKVRARRELVRRIGLAADGVESFLEERAWATVLTGKRFARLIRQHVVTVDGVAFRLDAYDPVTRTAVEFDGARWHAGDSRVRDTRRDAALATVGIMTVRFGYQDVMSRSAWCGEVLARVLAARSGSVTYHYDAA